MQNKESIELPISLHDHLAGRALAGYSEIADAMLKEREKRQ